MPVHDWARVDAGLFHHFLQAWTADLCRALNRGLLPAGYSALIEGKVTGAEPDLMAVAGRSGPGDGPSAGGGGLLVSEAPPRVQHVSRPTSDAGSYAGRANRVGIWYKGRQLVAVIEVVSPGNKDRKSATERFVRKAVDLLVKGVNLLVVDLFPPTAHDPQGVYKLIWDEVRDEPFALPPDKPLVLASCTGEPAPTAYVQPVGVGDPLPSMPLFLDEQRYIPAPLDATYAQTWEDYPADFRDDVLHPGG